MIKLPQFAPRLAVAGHLKNGINVPTTNRDGVHLTDDRNRPRYHPEQLDHYLVTTLQRNPETNNYIVDARAMKALEPLCDDDGKLRRIPLFVHSDDLEQFFPTQLEARKGKVICCRGDGETAKRVDVERGQKVGRPFEVGCPCPWLTPRHERDADAKNDPECKGTAHLRCKIALPDTITIGSVYDFHTAGIISIPNMLGGFAEIQNTIGTLMWVPLFLELRAERVQPEGYIKTVYSNFIHLRGDDGSGVVDIKAIQDRSLAMVRAAQEVQQIAGRRTLISLPAPVMDEEDEAAISEEFYPDAVETTASEKDAPAKEDVRGERQRKDSDHVSKANKMTGEVTAPPQQQPEPAPPQPEPPPPQEPRVPTHLQPATNELRARLSSAMNELVYHKHNVVGDSGEQRKLFDRLWASLVKLHPGYKWMELSVMQCDELLEELRLMIDAAKNAKLEVDQSANQQDLYAPQEPTP